MVQSLKAADAWLYCSFFIPVLALVVNVIAQVLLLRGRRVEFLQSIVMGCTMGGVALLLLDASLIGWLAPLGEGLVIAFFVHIPTYGALSYCYFGVANLGQTSIRIRIYSEILAAPSGMSTADIERLYTEGAFAAMRLQRSLDSGDIVEKGGRYFIGKNRLRHAANIMFGAKRFLFGKSSEFQE